MVPFRVIPALLLSGSRLVKTIQFKNPAYVGDPRNAVKIFNEKEVDELTLLDISATVEGYGPRLDLIREIAGEAFMPVTYGGGISTLEQIAAVAQTGIEKVCICTQAIRDSDLVRRAADRFGSSTIVVALDVKKSRFRGYEVWVRGGRENNRQDPRRVAEHMQEMGAGELLVNAIDRDGTQSGYDLDLVRDVATAVDIPVVACGGAGRLEDFADAVYVGKASAVAAGSYFVFHGKHRAVLINYPSPPELERVFADRRQAVTGG